ARSDLRARHGDRPQGHEDISERAARARQVREPIWLSADLVIAIHDEQLRQFGGLPGLRDQGLLESALGRPLNKHAYESPDLASVATAFGFGLARNHAFVDGNKRIAFLAIVSFLGLNNVDLVVPE